MPIREVLEHAIPGMKGSSPDEGLEQDTPGLNWQTIEISGMAQIIHAFPIGRVPAPLMLQTLDLALRFQTSGEFPKRRGMIRQTPSMEENGILQYPSLMGKEGKNRSTNKKEHTRKLIESVISRAEVIGKGKLNFHHHIEHLIPAIGQGTCRASERAEDLRAIYLDLGLIRRMEIKITIENETGIGHVKSDSGHVSHESSLNP